MSAFLPKKPFSGTVYGVEVTEEYDPIRCMKIYLMSYKGMNKYIQVDMETYQNAIAGHFLDKLIFKHVNRFKLEVESKIMERMGNQIFGSTVPNYSPTYYRSAVTTDSTTHAYNSLPKKEKDFLSKMADNVESWLKPAKKVMYEGCNI